LNPASSVSTSAGEASPAASQEAKPSEPAPAQPHQPFRGLASYSGARLFAVSVDGKKLATFGEGIGEQRAGNAVTVWDFTSGRELWTIAEPKNLTALAFSPDGKWLAGAALDAIRIFETASGTTKYTGPGCTFTGIGFNSDGSQLLVWGDKIKITTIQLEGLQLTKREFGANSYWMVSAAYRTSDGMFAAGKVIRYLNLETKKSFANAFVEVERFESGQSPRRLKLDEMLTSLAFSADGGTLAGSIVGGHIIVWDGKTFEQRANLARPRDEAPKRKFIQYEGISVSPDGAWAAIRALGEFEIGVGRELEIWDLAAGRRTHYDSKPCEYSLFLPDGKLLVAYKNEPLKMLNPATAQPLPLPGL
jgi:WD40 repeat protein